MAIHDGSPDRTRTCDIRINSPSFYQLDYRGIYKNNQRSYSILRFRKNAGFWLKVSDSNCYSCSQGKRVTITPYPQYGTGEGDRTPTALRQRILSPLCLPIPPLPHMAAVVGIEPTIMGSKPTALSSWLHRYVVLAVGFEPTRYYYQQILSLSCLPIPSRQHINLWCAR